MLKSKTVLTALLVDLTKALHDKVALKGGTSAMLFYHLPRLSLDLDFDVLRELEDRDKARLAKGIERHGQIKEQTEKRFTIFYLIDYERDTPNIKIELNTRVRQHNSYKTEWLFGVPIRIADEATMLTNKLVALTDRRLPVARDVFDIYFFLKNNLDIKPELIKERTGSSLDDHLKLSIRTIEENFSGRNILSGIGELLDEQQKSWARDHLKEETIFLLRQRIENSQHN